MKIDKRAIRVLGKGKTAQALKEKFINAKLYDDSDFHTYDLESEELTVVSPGIPPYNQMIESSKNIISDYDLFYEQMPLSIWITGTNGKTTTSQMTQHILKDYDSVCGGNIGVPLSNLDPKKKIWILETSSFSLHYTKYAKPNIFILLPISEDHITWHGSFEEYKKSKLKPLLLMEENDIAIIPKEFENIKTNAHTIVYKNTDDLCKVFEIDKKSIKFKEPFLLDSVLALASCKILFDKVDYKTINEFVLDKHKVEEFRDNQNRLWIDDSKATNVDATLNALKSYLHLDIHLILGGDDKGANLEKLFEFVKDYNIYVYAIGSNTKRVLEYCDKYEIAVKKCITLENAIKNIDENLSNNAIAMLSPAASSLDQFKSYSHRGNEFKKYVNSLR